MNIGLESSIYDVVVLFSLLLVTVVRGLQGPETFAVRKVCQTRKYIACTASGVHLKIQRQH